MTVGVAGDVTIRNKKPIDRGTDDHIIYDIFMKKSYAIGVRLASSRSDE
jgi:hypothetical protein